MVYRRDGLTGFHAASKRRNGIEISFRATVLMLSASLACTAAATPCLCVCVCLCCGRKEEGNDAAFEFNPDNSIRWMVPAGRPSLHPMESPSVGRSVDGRTSSVSARRGAGECGRRVDRCSPGVAAPRRAGRASSVSPPADVGEGCGLGGTAPRWIDDGRRSSVCLLYTSPSPRDRTRSRMPSSA